MSRAFAIAMDPVDWLSDNSTVTSSHPRIGELEPPGELLRAFTRRLRGDDPKAAAWRQGIARHYYGTLRLERGIGAALAPADGVDAARAGRHVEALLAHGTGPVHERLTAAAALAATWFCLPESWT